MRVRYLTTALFYALTTSAGILAQGIFFDNCSDIQACLPINTCASASVTAAMSATTSCGNPTVNFSHRVDFGNNGSTDIDSPGGTLTANFPLGQSKITWRATSGCGHVATCTQIVTVQDCQAPNLLCRNGITQSFDNNCQVTINAQQYVLSVSDNCTPTNQLQFGLRRAGSGTGFPPFDTLQYKTCSQGTNIVEVWVRDANGLANQCANYVIIQDNSNQCPCIQDSDIQVAGCARTAQNGKLNSYRVNASFSGTANGTPYQTTKNSNFTDSCFTLKLEDLPLNLSGNLRLRLSRVDNITNGVTAYDLILISRQILNLEPFTSFYQALAADVNGSKTVTTFDIVEIRKVILGVVDTFSAVPSWQFIRPVADPSDILASFAAMKDTFNIPYANLSGVAPAVGGMNWVGVKSGDVELVTSWQGEPDERTGPDMAFAGADRWIRRGERVMVPVHPTETGAFSAWQLGLRFSPEALHLRGVAGVPADAWRVGPDGALRLLWMGENPGESQTLAPEKAVFALQFEAMEDGWLSAFLQNDTEVLAGEAVTETVFRRPLSFQYAAKAGASETVVLFDPSPNPGSGTLRFPVQLSEDADLSLEMVDVSGKVVYRQQVFLTAGLHTLQVDGAVFPQAGWYGWRISTGAHTRSGKLIRR